MAVVNEVITRFGFQGDISPLHDYNDALGESIGLLAGAAAGIVATAGALGLFITKTTESLDPMIQLSRTTGIAVEDLQELSYVASVTDSSTEALQSSISGLAEKIGEAAQQGSEDFARLGISVRDANGEVKDTDDLLLEIGDRFRELDLSMAERQSFAQRLGIDPSLIQTLALTSDEMANLRDRARAMGTINEEQAEAANRLSDAVTTLKFGMDGLRNSIVVGLAPRMEELADDFIDFLEVNREVISEGISQTIEFIQTLAAAIIRLTPVITGLAVAFGVWKIATIGLGTVLATVFAPVYVITAAIVALLFVVDDLIVAFQGGQSVIADFFQEFFGIDIVPHLRSIVDAATQLFEGLAAVASKVIGAIIDIFKGLFSLITGDFDGAMEHFSSGLNALGEVVYAAVQQLLGFFQWLWGNIASGFSEIGSWIVAGFSSAVDSMSDVGSRIVTAIVDPIQEGFRSLFDWITEGFGKITDFASGVADFFGFGEDEQQEEQERSESADQARERRARLTPTALELFSEDVESQVVVNREFSEQGEVPSIGQPSDLTLMRRVKLINQLESETQGVIQTPEFNENLIEIRRVELRNQVQEDEVKRRSEKLELQRDVEVQNNLQEEGALDPSTIQQFEPALRDRDVMLRNNLQEEGALDPSTIQQFEPALRDRDVMLRNNLQEEGDVAAQPERPDPLEFSRQITVINSIQQELDFDERELSVLRDPMEISRRITITPDFDLISAPATRLEQEYGSGSDLLGQQNLTPEPLKNNNISNSVEQNVQIDIRSEDPKAAGRSVKDNLQEQLRDAQAQFDVGGF